MADFYDEMAAMTRELLAEAEDNGEGGLGQGVITIERLTAGPPPANSWDPPSPSVKTTIDVNGAVKGISAELVGAPIPNGGQMVATDLEAITEVPTGGYRPADIMRLDGKAVSILSVQNIPAVGKVCAIRFILRA